MKGSNSKVIREVVSELPPMVVSEEGKLYQLNFEIDSRDSSGDTLYISYKHLINKNILVKEKVLLSSDNACFVIKEISDFLEHGKYYVFKGWD